MGNRRRMNTDLILAAVFILLSFSVFSDSYFFAVGISPDSCQYLRAAENILAGNGFFYNKLAGDSQSWFATWPIGYPALIAFVSFVTGLKVYLASKMISIAIIFLLLLTFRIRFKGNAWVYAVSLATKGFAGIFYYTWSEQPFMLGLLWFSLALYDICSGEKEVFWNYVWLSIAGLLMFLSRWPGAIYVPIIAVASLPLFIAGWRKRTVNKQEIRKAVYLVITAGVNLLFILVYLALNRTMSGYSTGINRPVPHLSLNAIVSDLAVNHLRVLKGSILSCLGIVLIIISWTLIKSLVKASKSPSLAAVKSRLSVYFLVVSVSYWIAMLFFCVSGSASGSGDGFSFDSRYIYPAAFLLFFAVITFFLEQVPDKFSDFAAKIKPSVLVFGCILLILLSTLAINANGFRSIITLRTTFGYTALEKRIENKYRNIPEFSEVLWAEREVSFIRPDLTINNPASQPFQETIEQFLGPLKGKNNVYMDIEGLKHSLADPRLKFHNSIYVFFSKYADCNGSVIKMDL